MPLAGLVPDAGRRRLGIREDDRRNGGKDNVTPEQVGRFFAALAGGDADTLREINAPDSVNWHSDDPPDIVRL
jgi:hypothetical protein